MVSLLKKVQPYHAIDARRRDGVYHDRADCPHGRLVPSDHLASGSSGLRYCEECRALSDQAQNATGPR
jgi:hypothetical protein